MGEGTGSDAEEFCSRVKEKISVHLIRVGDVFHYRSSRKRPICSDTSSSFIPVNSVSIYQPSHACPYVVGSMLFLQYKKYQYGADVTKHTVSCSVLFILLSDRDHY